MEAPAVVVKSTAILHEKGGRRKSAGTGIPACKDDQSMVITMDILPIKGPASTGPVVSSVLFSSAFAS